MKGVLLCLLLLARPMGEAVLPTDPPSEPEEVLRAIDLAPWDSFFSQIEGTELWQMPSRLAQALTSGETDGGKRLIAWIKGHATGGFRGGAAMLLLSLGAGALASLCGLVGDGPDKTGQRVLSIGLCVLLLGRMVPLVQVGIRCVGAVVELANVSVPLMTGALLLLGGPQSAAAMGALGELLLNGCFVFLQNGAVPLAVSAGVLRAADLTGEGMLSSVSRLLFTLLRWGNRALCLCYGLFAALTGSGALGADSLMLRTGRVAAGSLPMVGSIVSDSLGSVAACLGLVRSAVGRAGMLLVLLLMAEPASALLIHGFSLRTAAAILGPLEQREMAGMVGTLGETLTALGAILCAAGAMLAAALCGVTGCLGIGL